MLKSGTGLFTTTEKAMNNSEFNALGDLLGINPTPQQPEQAATSKPQHPSTNYYEAPTYRGENLADLTDDERSAESVDRSEIDQANAISNLCEAMGFVGAGSVMTLGLSAFSNPGFGLGVSLVGCLVFGTGAASKSGKANLVRTAAMGVGASFGMATVANKYQQNGAIETINTSIEQLEIPKSAEFQIPLQTWMLAGLVFALVVRWVLEAARVKQNPQTAKPPTLPF